jgi:hypothetical protein
VDEASYRRNYSACEAAVATVARRREEAEEAGDDEATTLLNVIQFALLFNLDLTSLLHDLGAARSNWHQRLHSRHLILLLFECVDDFIALLGKNFRTVISTRPRGNDLLERLNGLHRQLREFQENYTHFRELRITLIAHRDHDASRLFALLASIDIGEVDAAAGAMLDWLTALHNLCTDAMSPN